MPLVTLLYIGVNISYLTVLTPAQVLTSSAVAVVRILSLKLNELHISKNQQTKQTLSVSVWLHLHTLNDKLVLIFNPTPYGVNFTNIL